jgi:hypothetical protein
MAFKREKRVFCGAFLKIEDLVIELIVQIDIEDQFKCLCWDELVESFWR